MAAAVTAAEDSLAREEYDLAVGRLTEVRSRLKGGPESLMPLRERIEELLAQAEAKRRLERFRKLVEEIREQAYYRLGEHLEADARIHDHDRIRLPCT